MSSTNLFSRALVLAGLVAAVSLPRSARAQSVTPEQALLNRMAATAFSGVNAPAAAQPVIPAVIDGARALLNRSHTVFPKPVESAQPFAAEASVDGVKALLNRSST